MNSIALALTLSLMPLLAGAAADEPVEEEKPPPSLLGEVSRDQIEAAEPEWVAEQVESEVDSEAAMALSTVDPGAKLTIYLGTWCGDSKRELARFWRALDEAGIFDVDVHYVAVDRRANRRPELREEVGLYWVPTFIVERDGREVGRVVEEAQDAIERDLLALLRGEARGVLTGREDGAVLPSEDEAEAEGEGAQAGEAAGAVADDDAP